ncbi:MAG: phosphatase PAP2 family protein [Gemmatimonadota bacterium]|nr:MAG: phosphatase PAP2 family protein [Gemmatimonadota bacterium]
MISLWSRWRAVRPLEALTICYLFVLSILILIFHQRVEGWIFYILAHLVTIGGVVFLVWSTRRTGWSILSGIRDWYMLFLFVPMFEEMGGLIRILGHDWVNGAFIAFDQWLFGTHPTVLLEQTVHPWLTEFMQLSFVSYYFIFYVVGAYVYFVAKKRSLFRSLLFKAGFAFYLSFAGFILFPAEGPWVTLKHLQTVPLEGGFFHHLANLIEQHGTIPGGAFPSSHITVAFAVLTGTFTEYRNLFYTLLPIFLCMSVSTVYGRYHYVADVIAGIAIGVACAFLGARIEQWWERRAAFQI